MRTFRWSIFALSLSLLARPHSLFAYSVTGGRIVDAQGQAVELRGVNWFGFETTDYVVHGLWARNWKSMIDQMRDLGINAVRLPVCPGTLLGSTPGTINARGRRSRRRKRARLSSGSRQATSAHKAPFL
jgi:endoglucanase